MLRPADNVSDVRNAWFFFHTLFEVIWHYRFLYRDLNDLLSKNRRLETHFQRVLADKSRVVKTVLEGLERSGALRVPQADAATVVTGMVVVLTYWLSFEYVRDPRRALEPESANAALLRGAFHVLSLLAPYLEEAQRAQLTALMSSARHPSMSTCPAALGSAPAVDAPPPQGAFMSELQTRFELAVTASRALPEKPDNLMLLKLYALFKQASIGDVEGERPGLPDFVGGAKWDAWHRLQGTPRDVAMGRYIDLVDALK
jgi:acyl-CoA-binding protein